MERKLESIGERLRYARESKGLKQPQLAKLAGVSQQMISKLENNNASSTAEIFPLADALGVSARWLATGDNGKERKENAPLNIAVLRHIIESVDINLPDASAEKRDDLVVKFYSYVLENGTSLKEIDMIIKLVI